ncbi:phenylacetaldehyde dehydrogenase StyD [Nocardia cyriacigeorgica]|uniref:phenylacetaldehyde dehydrogenase StyD n=1 Tax=Nocardia cyriacigeorgica TaxID=135487 RepID=UPI003EE3FC84
MGDYARPRRAAVGELFTSLYIGGEWRVGRTGQAFPDIDPATGEKITDVSAGDADDIDAAVTAARAQLNGEWRTVPGTERSRLLHRLADLIDRDAAQLAALEAWDIGRPVQQPAILDLPHTAATYRYFAGWADKISGQAIPTAGYFGRPTHSYTRREPIGVIGAIIPWNTPLMITGWKLAPALAAGNTVVIKPPEDAPLSVLHLASLIDEAGFPPGVVNVVPGLGETAGHALASHPDVDKITFTGSPEVGKTIQRTIADTFKRCVLELGGKSPQIVLEDADIEAAVRGVAQGLFFNQGEVCAAGSRIFVHRSRYHDLLDGLAEAAAAQKLGDPFDPATTMGPLINARQRETVLGYIEKGLGEGARIVAGGGGHDGPGYFVPPTIFADATNDMTIAREEIFGPVGTVIPFDTLDDAVAMANDTVYGLAATVWTNDVSIAHTVAADLRVGAVAINGWSPLDPALPWGGVKTSGIGRELGWSGIEANTEEKTVTVVL